LDALRFSHDKTFISSCKRPGVTARAVGVDATQPLFCFRRTWPPSRHHEASDVFMGPPTGGTTIHASMPYAAKGHREARFLLVVCDPTFPLTWTLGVPLPERTNGPHLPCCLPAPVFAMNRIARHTPPTSPLQWGRSRSSTESSSARRLRHPCICSPPSLGFADQMFKNIKVE